MNTPVKYSRLETCLSLLLVAVATVSMVFGVSWSLCASTMLHF